MGRLSSPPAPGGVGWSQVSPSRHIQPLLEACTGRGLTPFSVPIKEQELLQVTPRVPSPTVRVLLPVLINPDHHSPALSHQIPAQCDYISIALKPFEIIVFLPVWEVFLV